MLILSLPSVNFKHHGMSFVRRQVGPFMKSSILGFENESDQLFPYSILSHCPGIPQIYKLVAELPHHDLFHFTHFALKNSKTWNFTVQHSVVLTILVTLFWIPSDRFSEIAILSLLSVTFTLVYNKRNFFLYVYTYIVSKYGIIGI